MSDALVVVLRGSGTAADLRRTTDALRAHTSGVEFDIRDGGGSSIRQPASPSDAGSRPVVRVVGAPDADDEVTDRLAWDLLRTTPKADVVLLRIGLAVDAGWREGLRVAAYRDAVIATASAVPARLLAIDSAWGDGLEALAGSTTATALGGPLWGCVYLRRDALNVALAARPEPADPDSGPSPRFEDVVLVPGLVHVLASSVVVAESDRPATEETASLTPAVRRALAATEVRVKPLRVRIDLRCCSYPLTGTQVHALNLASSLASRQEVQLSVLLPERVDESARTHVDALPASVTRVWERSDVRPPHVFHRPYQVLTEHEIIDVV